MRRTKIVCTLGPATDSPEVISSLIEAGMDVARINFSHGSLEEHARHIKWVREASEASKCVAVMADLQGPKTRIGQIAAGQATLEQGQAFTLTLRNVPGDDQEVTLPHPDLVHALQAGDSILLDDGLIELRVVSADQVDVRTQVITGGPLMPHKGVTAPRVELSIPALTEKDREDLAFALEQGVDYVALSFVQSGDDVRELRDLMDQHGRRVPIVAKIEKPQATLNIEEIIDTADGVMIARGDLGVEIPPEQVPLQQKRIITLAREAAKPVITATQMLESMIQNPRPTRAEASDVANAIFDGTDAIMLSGETAVGRYPLDALAMMVRIAEATETAEWYRRTMLETPLKISTINTTQSISEATCEVAQELNVKAIVPSTISGYTARMVSRYRPAQPILAITPEIAVRRQLSLVWGINCRLVKEYATIDEMITLADEAVSETGVAEDGDIVVITAGIPLGQGRTNMLQVHTVGAELH